MQPEKNAHNAIFEELVLNSLTQNSGLKIHTRALLKKAQDPMALKNIFGMTLPRSLYDRNGKIQQEVLSRFLAHSGCTIDDFELMLEQAVERDVALDVLRLATPITQKEIDRAALKEHATRTYTIATYNLDPYLKKAHELIADEETLKNFFESENGRSHRYWSPEKRSGIVWRIATTTENKDKLIEQVQGIVQASPEVFDAFIAKNKAIKSIITDAVLNQKNVESTALFRGALSAKNLTQDGTTLIIAQPTSIIPTIERPYQSAAKEVKSDYYHAQAQKLLLEELEGAPENLKAVTKKVVLTPKNSKIELEKLSKEDISADRMLNMVFEGSRFKGLNEQGGYMVTLSKVEMPDQITSEQRAELERALFKENERFITAVSVDSLVKSAKI